MGLCDGPQRVLSGWLGGAGLIQFIAEALSFETFTDVSSVSQVAFGEAYPSICNAVNCIVIEDSQFRKVYGTVIQPFTIATEVSPVPLPAALPLFASGLGALGLLGWRRKRKAAALAA